ncbi:MAG: hypothetical protein ACI87A_003877, partial [Planctomycetota bacterium]
MNSRRALSGFATIFLAILCLVYVVNRGEYSNVSSPLAGDTLGFEGGPQDASLPLNSPTTVTPLTTNSFDKPLKPYAPDSTELSGSRRALPPDGDRAILRVELVDAESGQPLLYCEVFCESYSEAGDETEQFESRTKRSKFDGLVDAGSGSIVVDELARIIHEHADQTPRTTGTAGRSWC